jgi:hypothetical protein
MRTEQHCRQEPSLKTEPDEWLHRGGCHGSIQRELSAFGFNRSSFAATAVLHADLFASSLLSISCFPDVLVDSAQRALRILADEHVEGWRAERDYQTR